MKWVCSFVQDWQDQSASQQDWALIKKKMDQQNKGEDINADNINCMIIFICYCYYINI